MIEERFDAIVVGAGMAGNAAALSMAKRGMKVLQLERGEYSGSKNVQGAVVDADIVEQLTPEFHENAPLERLVEQRFWIMESHSHIGLRYRFNDCNHERPNRYIVIRSQFDKWFSCKVKEAGATVLCQTTVTELAQNRRGRVIGVRTDRQDGIIRADVVVLAEGVNGLLGTCAGLRERPTPEQVALEVKEMHLLPRETIENRFGIKRDEGIVIEATGTISDGMTGMGFIYANRECISLGIGCLVSDLQRTGETPYGLLDRFKRHPSVVPLIDGSELNEYSAHLIPKRGYNTIPQLYGNGWVVIGDAAELDSTSQRGRLNVAMISGKIAAEAIFRVKSRGGRCTSNSLSLYKKLLNEAYQDLNKKDIPALMHTQPDNLLLTYPQLVSKAIQNFARVAGGRVAEETNAQSRSSGDVWSWIGLFGDGFRFPRA
ncbi:FAD-dependent oxidoreductase [Bradyrhizobium neotropicale]|uniref:FAD-dependent oxidoreductase n=1 Tax=Bradyrhizobium neotropicale TaxID=1497615 RepID=UPI001AD6FC94|nr:FAD-dependent oxidoreductase [Bradyrhizobium neotropicale]MBO4227638.1 FAD-dependent oxidoreductase [Bradyrhizobium neotropicale]